jgi:hypothetical protein
MGIVKITQYTHRPNSTELGLGNTHECYMLVATDIDMSGIFPPGESVSIYDALTRKEYVLKSSNYREFRINQMGDIYRDYNVIPGDEIVISQIEKDNVCDLCFTVKKYHRVVLLVKKGLAEIINIDRLKAFEQGDKKYEVNVYDKGKNDILNISFDGAKAKRADSPNMTDFYHVSIDGVDLPNGTYYLTLGVGSDKNILATLPKSDFNTIEFDDSKILSMKESLKKMRKSDIPLQQIFYGAPGTGKSHAINELTAGKDVIRTTFHPDTDYSTFVGAYKPTTKSVPVITVIGTEAVPVRDKNGKEMMEDKIVYEYVSQAFLQAYVAAWRKYCDVQEGEEPVDEFLVIEEINRGNCAQIFGDLFQLLDRGDEGFSEYPIKADSDMKKLLEKEFEGLEIKNKEGINALFKGGKDIVAEVLAGDILLLPNNLYIWATMNTSDQSLFPIDSAFKRRWDWNYVPISNAGKNWMIEVNGAQYDWWKFLEAINDKVYHATYSEDKKLGYFFCKAKDGVISADKFVSKVIFYLWNDVFKDSEFEGDTFKDEDGEKLSFDKFYSVENNQVKVNGTKIVKFLSNLNLEPDSEADEDNSEEGFETEGDKKLPRTPKVFTVEFPDGTVINENNKFDTYHKTLSKIGIEQVEKIAAEMKYHRRHTPLVTKSKYEAILNDPTFSYIQEGDCYIVKGINNITMYRMVMLLDNRLDLQLKVCYE